MILRSIALKDWRCFRDERKFEFQPGLNILVGENEAGKSTVLDGLVRAFYEKHSSGNADVAKLRPHESKLDPKVTVRFDVDGDRYQIHKQFLNGKTSVLSKLKGESWERISEGDRADNDVRELVHGGERGAGRLLQPEVRGLAQALWLLQTDGAEVPIGWTTQVTEGLGGIATSAAETPQTRAFLELLEKEYSNWFTEKGFVKTDGVLHQAEKAAARAREEYEKLVEQARNVDNTRAKIFGLEEQRRRCLFELEARIKAAEGIEELLADASAYEAKHLKLTHSVESTGLAEKTLANQVEQVLQNESALTAMSELAARIQTDLKVARYEREASQAERESIRVELESLKPIEAELRKKLRSIEAAHRLRKLSRQAEDLVEAIARIKGIEDELATLRMELIELRPPTEADYSDFQANQRNLAVALAQRAASAIRVQFQLENPDLLVPPDSGSTEGEEGVFLITRSTEFSITGVGKVIVGGGGDEVESIDRRCDELGSARNVLLSRYAMTEDAEMEKRHHAATRLRDRIVIREKDLQLVSKGHPHLADDLDRVRKGIEEERTQIVDLETGWETLGGEVLRKEAEGLENEIAATSSRIGLLEEASETALASAQRASESEAHLDVELTKLETRQTVLQEENARIIREYGSRAELMARSAQSHALAEAERAAFEKSQLEFEIRVTAPRAQAAAADQASQNAKNVLNGIDQTLAVELELLRRTIGDGFSDKLEAAEELRDERLERYEQLKRRGEGLKLLREIVKFERTTQAMALVKPVSDIINPWLKYITANRYEEMALSPDLIPQGLRRLHDKEPLKIDSLSRGTTEQTGLLIRLALAKLVAGSRPFPIVLDDRLVNTDRGRMDRFAYVLKLLSEGGQMIITTCDELRYVGLGGNILQL